MNPNRPQPNNGRAQHGQQHHDQQNAAGNAQDAPNQHPQPHPHPPPSQAQNTNQPHGGHNHPPAPPSPTARNLHTHNQPSAQHMPVELSEVQLAALGAYAAPTVTGRGGQQHQLKGILKKGQNSHPRSGRSRDGQRRVTVEQVEEQANSVQQEELTQSKKQSKSISANLPDLKVSVIKPTPEESVKKSQQQLNWLYETVQIAMAELQKSQTQQNVQQWLRQFDALQYSASMIQNMCPTDQLHLQSLGVDVVNLKAYLAMKTDQIYSLSPGSKQPYLLSAFVINMQRIQYWELHSVQPSSLAQLAQLKEKMLSSINLRDLLRLISFAPGRLVQQCYQLYQKKRGLRTSVLVPKLDAILASGRLSLDELLKLFNQIAQGGLESTLHLIDCPYSATQQKLTAMITKITEQTMQNLNMVTKPTEQKIQEITKLKLLYETWPSMYGKKTFEGLRLPQLYDEASGDQLMFFISLTESMKLLFHPASRVEAAKALANLRDSKVASKSPSVQTVISCLDRISSPCLISSCRTRKQEKNIAWLELVGLILLKIKTDESYMKALYQVMIEQISRANNNELQKLLQRVFQINLKEVVRNMKQKGSGILLQSNQSLKLFKQINLGIQMQGTIQKALISHQLEQGQTKLDDLFECIVLLEQDSFPFKNIMNKVLELNQAQYLSIFEETSQAFPSIGQLRLFKKLMKQKSLSGTQIWQGQDGKQILTFYLGLSSQANWLIQTNTELQQAFVRLNTKFFGQLFGQFMKKYNTIRGKNSPLEKIKKGKMLRIKDLEKIQTLETWILSLSQPQVREINKYVDLNHLMKEVRSKLSEGPSLRDLQEQQLARIQGCENVMLRIFQVAASPDKWQKRMNVLNSQTQLYALSGRLGPPWQDMLLSTMIYSQTRMVTSQQMLVRAVLKWIELIVLAEENILKQQPNPKRDRQHYLLKFLVTGICLDLSQEAGYKGRFWASLGIKNMEQQARETLNSRQYTIAKVFDLTKVQRALKILESVNTYAVKVHEMKDLKQLSLFQQKQMYLGLQNKLKECIQAQLQGLNEQQKQRLLEGLFVNYQSLKSVQNLEKVKIDLQLKPEQIWGRKVKPQRSLSEEKQLQFLLDVAIASSTEVKMQNKYSQVPPRIMTEEQIDMTHLFAMEVKHLEVGAARKMALKLSVTTILQMVGRQKPIISQEAQRLLIDLIDCLSEEAKRAVGILLGFKKTEQLLELLRKPLAQLVKSIEFRGLMSKAFKLEQIMDGQLNFGQYLRQHRTSKQLRRYLAQHKLFLEKNKGKWTSQVLSVLGKDYNQVVAEIGQKTRERSIGWKKDSEGKVQVEMRYIQEQQRQVKKGSPNND